MYTYNNIIGGQKDAVSHSCWFYTIKDGDPGSGNCIISFPGGQRAVCVTLWSGTYNPLAAGDCIIRHGVVIKARGIADGGQSLRMYLHIGLLKDKSSGNAPHDARYMCPRKPGQLWLTPAKICPVFEEAWFLGEFHPCCRCRGRPTACHIGPAFSHIL